jgi:integrase/recombinase XerD
VTLHTASSPGSNHKKYPTRRNIKKAKTLEEIEKIIEYPCNDLADILGRDAWLFSYLCNGANMAVILRIRWRDLGGDHFAFLRKKNINTRKKNLTPTEERQRGI